MKKTAIGLLLLIGTAACPAMSPVGSPSNPAGVSSTDKTDSEKTSSTSDSANPGDITSRSLPGPPSSAGGDTPPSPPPPSPPPISPPNGGGSPDAVAQGGTFCPKGDNEAVGEDLLFKAIDWRLLFVYGSGTNDWWELSRTTPDRYAVFKDSTTDLKLRLEANLPDCGWVAVLPGLKALMVYKPLVSYNQLPYAYESTTIDMTMTSDRHNLEFSVPLAEGTVTLSVDYKGVTHPLGSLTTYYPDVDMTTAIPYF